VLPQEKAGAVRKLQEAGNVVAFVGDGINDAPALAQADVGIAIGSGTDVAIESAEIVLIRDDLMDAVSGIQLSRKVMARIKQNIFWAFAYNAALIPVASGILYPFFGITLKPEVSGLAMAMSSVTVVSLSLMLKRYRPAAV
jgi:Cu+-exporting ATPase